MSMPLGDPHGGMFEYTVEGLPESVFAFTVPVSDVSRSILFYRDVLGMQVLAQDGETAHLRRGTCRVVLKRQASTGVDLGVYLSVDSPYNTRRRLSDEGVEFLSEPRRGPLGVEASFYDPDRNVLRVIDPGSDGRKE